jgi:hypothetical protein
MRSLVIPHSIYKVGYDLFNYLINHPLFYHPIVVHPITNQPVTIDYWRQGAGLVTGATLVASIFPAYKDDSNIPVGSGSITPSVDYKPYSVGNANGLVATTYNFVIRFTYSEVLYDNLNTLMTSITRSEPLFKEDGPFFSRNTSNVNYAISPSLLIISEYLELIRLALSDEEYQTRYCPSWRAIETKNLNYSASKWEEGANVITQEGSLLVCLDKYIDRDWRAHQRMALESFTLNLNPTSETEGNART